jgi:hypothetical protein
MLSVQTLAVVNTKVLVIRLPDLPEIDEPD